MSLNEACPCRPCAMDEEDHSQDMEGDPRIMRVTIMIIVIMIMTTTTTIEVGDHRVLVGMEHHPLLVVEEVPVVIVPAARQTPTKSH